MAIHDTDTHKVQFQFTSAALTALDALQKRIDAPSRSETIRYGLRVLDWIVEELDKGNKICLETENGIEKIMIPFLPSKPRSSKRSAIAENGVSS